MCKLPVYQFQGQTCYVKNQNGMEAYMEVCEYDFIFLMSAAKKEMKIDFVFCTLDSKDYDTIMANSTYVGDMDFNEYIEHRRKFLNNLHGFIEEDDDDSEPTFTDQSGLRMLGVTFRRPK